LEEGAQSNAGSVATHLTDEKKKKIVPKKRKTSIIVSRNIRRDFSRVIEIGK
jgi:hypothetical protein